MTRRRLSTLVATVAMALGLMAPAWAGGANAGDLADSGWTCFPAGPVNNIHCLTPSQGNGSALNVMVFTPDGGTFLGTEMLRFSNSDLTGQTCWKDGTTFESLGDGLYACHHWKGGQTPAD